MSSEALQLGVGTLVRVRQRTFLVEGVRTAPGAASVVALACVDDDAQGRRLDVIWEAEVDARIIPAGKSAIRANPTPDDPKRFAAYLHALRWGCVTSTDPTLFQAPLRAGIIPKSYQLEPLRKALALPRVNLFIADDVGVGKTIEAGLVLQELLLRQRVHRVVIAAPASVVLQWRDELSQRFGLGFAVLDKAYVNARRRERGFGVNAWTTHRHFLISHNLLRDEDYLVGLRDWLGDFCPGSLFILDEAHVAAPASESKYAIDSQTTRAIRDVARRFEHRLFLSATPHNGHSNSFSALLEILDPQRFTRGVPVKNAAALRPVMVRRLKAELRGHIESPIPDRVVEAIEIKGLPPDAPELALSAMLAEYSEILERRLAGASNRTRSAGKLVTLALQKRLLSSVEAFARTLAVHKRNTAGTPAATSAGAAEPASKRTALFDEDDDLADDQVSELEDVEVARATKAGASAADDARARRLLDEMTDIAAEARGLPDAKVLALLDWIRKNQCSEKGSWLARRILVFTEYVDTKSYLVAQLEAALARTDRADERILTIHGGMDEEARETVKQAFNDERHPVRVLIGTDAAREGLNLQAQCADLFHFDLPWNPGRMEQRNGRIDRILQPKETVYCRYFIYAQRPEDAVLEALVRKSERIRKQLGSLADILSRRLEGTLEDGIKRGGARALAERLSAADPEELRGTVAADELEQARDAEKDLKDQLRELAKLDQKAAQHLALRPERLCDVVNVGLALAGQPPLVERKGSPGVFDVPALDKLAGADATWRDIMDTLRRPRTRKMPEWEWRAKNPPRPVSFEPSTTLASDTVQLHLQHKLTQRALAQFRSQAFGEDELSRVTVLIDPDPNYRQKRILALGRLSLYGEGASRLHEEILAVAALWEEGDDPARLQPFKTTDAEEKALESLYAILSKDNPPAVSKHTVDKVMAHATRDEDALWETLERKALARAVWAEEKLRQRAKAEAEEMQRILDAQRGAIDKELKARRQLSLPWTTEEHEQKKQHEADTRHIEKRRAEIDREIASEPERIRDQYEVKHQRLERVGLVYLWPSTA
jgi:ERCC4-related helicase